MFINLGPTTILICLLCIPYITAKPFPTYKNGLKNFTFNEIFPNEFGLKGFNGTWVTGSSFMYKDNDQNYRLFNAKTNTSEPLLQKNQLTDYKGASIQVIGDDVTKFLIRYDIKSIFRHSTTSKYAIYDSKSGNYYDVADGEDVQICKMSPTGGSLVFVLGNNVYYRSPLYENAKEVRITDDGVPGIIYNGVPDWVYEEEVFSSDATLWYSPDGTKLAMAKFNDTKVEEFTYHIYGDSGDLFLQYPEEYKLRYPKVNTTNPDVHLLVKDLTNLTKKWTEVKAPVEKIGDDHILGRVNWINNEILGVIWTNRRQNVGTFQKCDILTNKCNDLFNLDEPNGWIILNKPFCTKDGKKCYMVANNNGWRKIVEINDDGKIDFITEKSLTVVSINGIDEINHSVFYTAVPAKTPHIQHFYENQNCLSCTILKDKLDNDAPCEQASFVLSTDQSYFVALCTGPNPAYTQVFNAKDYSVISDWELNLAKREKLKAYKETKIIYLQVPVEGGFKASVRLYLPPEIDVENPLKGEKKYPMLVQVYGGPNSVKVAGAFGIGYQNYLTTSAETIYCQIDGRGTANKGLDMLYTINNRLGTYEMEDQIAVTRYLQDNYKFIDAENTAIWGWSYGGYATAMTLAKDKQKVFKCGVSVAPVTSWLFYDSIYTERYMGVPRDNLTIQAYNTSDISQHIDELKNHQYLIIHGNADDNVHYQQSMVLIRELEKEDIEFEQMSYPDENHSLSGVQKHLYHTINHFWSQCFEKEFPV